MSTPDTSREPCPDRILDDAGGAFGMGVVGGSIYHYMKGLYNSPNGFRHAGTAQAVGMNAPRVGGSFAVWGTLFSSFDCAMVYARQKEDPWNSILAGAATGGLLSVRQGVWASGRSAIFGGCLLALIEGAGIWINRLSLHELPPPYLGQDPGPGPSPGPGPAPIGFPGRQQTPRVSGMAQTPPVLINEIPVLTSGPSGWFEGFFGKKKEDKAPAGGGDPNSEMLESFDTPSAPIPSFEFK